MDAGVPRVRREYLKWGSSRAIIAAIEARLEAHEAHCREERARFERLIERLDMEQDRRHAENLSKFDKINYVIAAAIGGGVVIAAIGSYIIHAVMLKLGFGG